MIEITFLGTGNAYSQQYYNTNLLVHWENTYLLIDCGNKCPISLSKLGIPIDRLRNIFITHLHADHIGGLEEVVLQAKYVYKFLPNLYIPQPIQNGLWEHSLKGGLQDTISHTVNIDHYFQVHPVHDVFTIENLTFQIIPTKHMPNMFSCGLLFHKIFFTGDTLFSRELIDTMLQKANYIIHDCSFTNNPVHTYYKDLLTLPHSIRNRIFLIHYGDNAREKLAYMESEGFRYAKRFGTIRLKQPLV